MAEARREFDKFSREQLKTLCDKSLEVISAALPYEETVKMVAKLKQQPPIQNKESLRNYTLRLFDIVNYCDTYKSAQGTLVKAQVTPVNKMLRAAILND